MEKRRLYVGASPNGRELFRAAETPTVETHPQYRYAIGPFRTVAGARFMAEHGERNPHVTCVADAERLARQS